MEKAIDSTITPGSPSKEGAYRYAAFISYRHTEPDRRWARWLHSALETYRLPTQLRRGRGLPKRLGRCFRDEEELPATDNLAREIEQALLESRFLIVVCSPRIVESRWCNKEVERFRELGRHDRILALLIEGEPAASFLPALREIRTHLTDTTGRTREEIQEVEPLAADVRATAGESPRHLRRIAKLRLLAQILGLRFDDLRQREQERRVRTLAMITTAAVLLLAITGGLAVAAFLARSEAVRERGIADQNAQRADTNAKRADANAQRADKNADDANRAATLAKENEAKANNRLARFYQEEGRRELLARNGDMAAVYLSAAYQLDPNNPSLGFLTHEAMASIAGISGVLKAHTAPVSDARFSADGTRVITFGDDRAVNVWAIPSGTRLAWGAGSFQAMFDNRALYRTSANGRWVLLAATNSPTNLDVFDTTTLKRVGTVVTPRESERWAISPDGKRLMIVHSASLPGGFGPTFDAAVTVWSLPDAKLIREIPAQNWGTDDIIPSPNGRQFLIGPFASAGSGLKLLDVDTGKIIASLPAQVVFAATFSPDASQAAYADRQPRSMLVRTVSTSTGRSQGEWDLGDTGVVRLLYSPDGKFIAAALNRGATTVRLKELATGATRDFVGNSGGLVDAEFSRDGRFLVACDSKQVLVFDVKSGTILAKESPHEDTITFCRFSADGSLVVTGSQDRSARLWQWRGADTLERWAVRYYGPALSGRFNAAGDKVIIAGDESRGSQAKTDHFIRILDARSGRVLQTLGPQPEPVGRATFFPDGLSVLTVTAEPSFILNRKDFLLRIWDVASGQLKRSMQGTLGALSPDGRVVAGTSFNRINLYDAENGATLSTGNHHQDKINLLAFSRTGRWMISSSSDLPLVLWAVHDPESPVPMDVPGIAAGLTDADFSADDHLLLAGSADGSAELWDLTAVDAGKGSPPRLLFTLSGHDGAVSCVRLSPDGKHAATGGVDGNAIEWDTATGKSEHVHEPPPDDATKTYSYENHPQAITAVCYSPDSLFLATGSSDGFVRVWDVQSGLLLLSQQVFQNDTVKDLDWSADGSSLLAANAGEVRLLDVSPESLPPDRLAEAVDRRSRYVLSDKGLEPRPQPRPVVLKSN